MSEGPGCASALLAVEQLTVLVTGAAPVLAQVPAVRDELELAAAQRVELARHLQTSVPIIETGCC